ncbi:MAG: SMC-Scp complex subunit ScpB [Candidatus Binataceae bacterium]
MEEERLKSILESLLFAAGEPLSIARIAAVLEGATKTEIQNSIVTLGAEYSANNRGLAIEEVAGGYQLRTPKEHAQYVRRLLAARPPRLSRPLLETVAIIAYRQPITRPEIEQLRGVDAGGVLETLLERRLVKIEGRKEAPGRPMMYATTPEFLEVFGLKDLESLPDLKEFQEIERAVEQTETGPVESIETHPEDAAPVADSAASESSAIETDGGLEAPPAHPEPEKPGGDN